MFTEKYLNLTELSKIMMDYIKVNPRVTRDSRDYQVVIISSAKEEYYKKELSNGLGYLVSKDGSVSQISKAQSLPITFWENKCEHY